MHVWPEKILFVIWLCCPILNYAILNYLNTTGEKFIMVDTFAHGLWSWIIFRNIKPTSDVWLAVFFGVMPDLFSWAIYMFYRFFTTGFKFGAPVLGEIPKWPFVLYGITHSIFVFGAVVLGLYFILGHVPYWILAWGIHILIDIPTHSRNFLPTPFLWPFFDWYFPGISWGTWWIMALNWGGIIIALIYIFFFGKR